MDTLGIIPAIEATLAARPEPAAVVAVSIPADDAPEEHGDDLGHAEGQSFVIEYVDSGGQASTRRITVNALRRNAAGQTLLQAFCHERRASRVFRADRIRCCIDLDGEVHDDVAAFLRDIFGASVVTASVAVPRVYWSAVVEAFRPEIVLLAAMSRCDFDVHAAETHAATDFVAARAEASGTMLDAAASRAIYRHIARLRPDVDAVLRAVAALAEGGLDRVRHALVACVRVMEADGRRHPAEMRLLNALSVELLGISLA